VSPARAKRAVTARRARPVPGAGAIRADADRLPAVPAPGGSWVAQPLAPAPGL